MQAPDYSTINGMVNRLRVDLGDSLVKSKGPVSVAVDASGIKVHNRRDWIRRAWKVRKGYLKIRFAVDIKTGEVVPTDATPEKVGNGRRLRRLVGDAEGRSGSGGPSPTALTTEGEPQLPRGGQSQSSGSGRERPRAEERGSPARKQAVIEQRKHKPRTWSGIHGFGSRWRVEGAFSAIKGIFGEYVTAAKFANTVKEMIMKAFIYNMFIAQIRGLPREASRGRDRWATRRGVVQHSTPYIKGLQPRRKAPDVRERCVRAISAFRALYGLRPLDGLTLM